jgi:hypothetical protein
VSVRCDTSMLGAPTASTEWASSWAAGQLSLSSGSTCMAKRAKSASTWPRTDISSGSRPEHQVFSSFFFYFLHCRLYFDRFHQRGKIPYIEEEEKIESRKRKEQKGKRKLQVIGKIRQKGKMKRKRCVRVKSTYRYQRKGTTYFFIGGIIFSYNVQTPLFKKFRNRKHLSLNGSELNIDFQKMIYF